jgi:hypothetical protein
MLSCAYQTVGVGVTLHRPRQYLYSQSRNDPDVELVEMSGRAYPIEETVNRLSNLVHSSQAVTDHMTNTLARVSKVSQCRPKG